MKTVIAKTNVILYRIPAHAKARKIKRASAQSLNTLWIDTHSARILHGLLFIPGIDDIKISPGQLSS